jgi:hypothetical protein
MSSRQESRTGIEILGTRRSDFVDAASDGVLLFDP